MSDDSSFCSAQERVETVKANFEQDPRTRQLMDLSKMEDCCSPKNEEETQSIVFELEHLKTHEDSLRNELVELETLFRYETESRDDPAESSTSAPPIVKAIPDLITMSYSGSLTSSASEEELLPVGTSSLFEKILSTARWQTAEGGLNLVAASDMWAAYFHEKRLQKRTSKT